VSKILILLICFGLIIGCTQPQKSYTIEEVNGISKVINSKQEIIPFELEPEVVIGNDESDLYFSRISQICEDENGNIYILDSGESAITVLDPDGKFIRKIGGKGKGPGEFIRPNSMMFTKNGNILISDTGNYRFQILDDKGNYINSYIPEDDMPGTTCYDNNGNIVNHNSSFSWGISDPSLFNLYDTEMNKIGKFGELLLDDDANLQHFNNMGSMITNSLNQIIFVRELDNEYTIYVDNKVARKFSVNMNIEPTEVEINIRTSGDNQGISIFRDPICFGLSIDSKDRIYSLIRNCESDTEDGEYGCADNFVIDVFDQSGIHLSRHGLGQNSYSDIYVGKDDKIYVVNREEASVLRFSAI